MKYTPLPTQLSGAKFLAARKAALLADEPRVGKTGAAIIAADYIEARKILVITTSSGRPVWRRGFSDWSIWPRSVQVISGNTYKGAADIAIVSWGGINNSQIRASLLNHKWDLLIPDEAHAAKNFEAKRTQALYGRLGNDGKLHRQRALVSVSDVVWDLTGTPIPNSLLDIYPAMLALCPERLAAHGDFPDVTALSDFKRRYCIIGMKKLSPWRRIEVVVGSRNEAELRQRLGDFMLRRTQQDVGIRPPIYDTLPLMISDRARREIDGGVKTALVLAAAEAGDTKKLEMELGPIRRLTGEIKARATVEAVIDEFDGGLDKIVLMAWHKDAIRILAANLAKFGVVVLDGSTSLRDREAAEARFRDDPKCRVFIGQIQAAGEAIDLSAAATLWFVEASFTPKDMAQAALRITNQTQKRQALVRVCVLDGPIDEALQKILMRKWTAIKEVLND